LYLNISPFIGLHPPSHRLSPTPFSILNLMVKITKVFPS